MSSFDAYLALLGNIQGEVIADEKLALHTSYRIGGPADLFIKAETYSDLTTIIESLHKHNVPWVIFGKGTNILVSDEGYRGAVIVLGREFNHYGFEDDGTVTVGAAVTLARVVQEAFQRGLSGLENMVGVPGTMGGAVSMNAGTRDEWIGASVDSVVVYRPLEGLVRYDGSEIGWFYRQTTLPPREIVLEVVLKLKHGDTSAIRAKMEAAYKRRKKTQPLNKPSCGSVFKNPRDASVGQLIEEAGLKGFTVGGASVSQIHANFIVNNGNATARDVLHVIETVQSKIGQVYGIELKPELKFLGF